MIFRVEQLEARAQKLGDQYRQDVMAVGRLVDNGQRVFMSDEDYKVLQRKYSIAAKVAKPLTFALAQIPLPVSEDVMARRQASCASCEWRSPSERFAGDYFCRACGCGDTERARLSTKYHKRIVFCRKRKDGWADAATNRRRTPDRQ
jgi:hypothetical protein